MAKRVPVTLITGFLGSGKTTFLRHLLKNNAGRRILVIQNEFSEAMGIESPQLVDDSGDVILDMYELPNGCMCCSVRDSIVGTLEAVLSSRPDRFDHVIVEGSGVADPRRLVGMFWLDGELESRVYLDSVIAVVDARNAGRYLNLSLVDEQELMSQPVGPSAVKDDVVINLHLLKESEKGHPDKESQDQLSEMQESAEGQRSALVSHLPSAEMETMNEQEKVGDEQEKEKKELSKEQFSCLAIEAGKQISAADVILLNKCDLVQSDDADHLQCLLRAINPLAIVYRCQMGQIPITKVLDLHAFNLATSSFWSDKSAFPSQCLHSSDHVRNHEGLPAGKDEGLPAGNDGGFPPSCHKCLPVGTPPRAELSQVHHDAVTTLNVTSAQNCFVELSISLNPGEFRLDELTTWPKPERQIWSLSEAERMLGSLLWDGLFGDIYRSKGLIAVRNEEGHVQFAAFQGVGEIFEVDDVCSSPKFLQKLFDVGTVKRSDLGNWEIVCRFLFVGRLLNPSALKAFLKSNVFLSDT